MLGTTYKVNTDGHSIDESYDKSEADSRIRSSNPNSIQDHIHQNVYY